MIDRLNEVLGARYRVEREVGAGGMATVFLAEDLKHHRRVALKVMSQDLTAVLGAERFLAEIQTTAGLTHPHILPLHDSGEADGLLYYVMPYVEGESLRDKLDRERQLPADEAVRIASDLAEALDHAHRRGVIHRDMKPGNILMQDGRPVIADFGIALAVGAATSTRVTETGLSLGTPHYMSPEQATGERFVGPQSDIYSLGALLYEMLVGEPPFTGPTAQAVLGQIISGGPASARDHRPSTPPNVDAAIRKALEKLPADRFTSAQDFGRALMDPAFRYGEGVDAGTGVAAAWRTVGVAAVAAAVVLGAALLREATRPGPSPPPTTRYGVEMAEGQELVDRDRATFALAPDGSALVYVGPSSEGPNGQLWLKPRDQAEARPIPGTYGAATPTFSPTGEWILYRVATQLRKVPAVGGSSITLIDSISSRSVHGAAWLDDGSLVFEGPAWDIRRMSAEGGPTQQLYEPGEGLFAYSPVALPGAVGVLFSLCEGDCTPADLMETWVYDFEAGESRRVAVGSNALGYAATGHLLTVRPDGGVFAVPFDLSTLEATGTPVPVLEGVKVDAFTQPDAVLTPEGDVLMLAGPGRSQNVELVWLDRSGSAEAVDPGWSFNAGDENQGWALSPDGRLAAVGVSGPDGRDIWVKELRPGGPFSRLTFQGSDTRKPRWSPDGEWVTFVTAVSGNLDVYRKRANGTGDMELVYDDSASLAQGYYTPDGEAVLLRTIGPSGATGMRDILLYTPGSGAAAQRLLADPSDEWAPAVSPDGRWIAYSSTESGRHEVYVRPYPDVESGRWQISGTGGRHPLWAREGDELFYVDQARQLVSVRLDPRSGPAVVESTVLFTLTPDIQVLSSLGYLDVAPDGQRFLAARAVRAENGTPPRLLLVQNWFTELAARLGG